MNYKDFEAVSAVASFARRSSKMVTSSCCNASGESATLNRNTSPVVSISRVSSSAIMAALWPSFSSRHARAICHKGATDTNDTKN
jgi:hypothetical protein